MISFTGSLEVRPFEVGLPENTLAEFRQLLQLSKIGPATFENTNRADNSYGISREWIEKAKDHWSNAYDWRATEKRINSFDNYKATITNEHGDDVELHFVALLSTRKDAVPVVLLHGWPGSFLEFLNLLDHARTLYKPEELPYSFIVPSLPGYAFSSDYSTQKQSTCESMAYAIEQLMVGLGFGAGYVAQGGDIGSFVARILAARHSARAAHINFALMPPPQEAGDMNEEEIQGLGRAAAFGAQGDAYAREHGQRPATIGLLLSTSPLALLIWIGEKFLDWVDDPLTLDQILDHASLYWLTETFPRAIYPYRQFFGPSPEAIPLKYYVDKPLGYSWFPKEIAPIPKAWVSTTGNLVWYRQHTQGGHFAALERPKDLFKDIEDFIEQTWT
ncbi:alpha/beta-hydrolase [Aureobasidium sp. EXF-8845]|nr:alpha/beta-hydrolase [Aureobasidium sp. EXF-8845]KAI4858385.1 alpha/beta-hydrolase [Aureobasidium sp. EXF-8846]